jgi:hypothetical protein
VARGGGELVLAHKKNVHEMEVSWLRTRDFSTVDTVEGAPFNHETLASPEQQVWAYPRKWAKQLMLSGELLPFCNGCRTAYFLTDDLVVLEEKGKYQIKTSSGETRANSKVNCGMFSFSLAATATRFAYAAGCYRGSGFPLQTHFAAHMDVDVFDWGTMKRTCRLKFDEPEKASIGGFKDSAIALSNDGRQLLVLTGSTLSLYRLE